MHHAKGGKFTGPPLSGLRVGRELDAIIAWRGKPAVCVSDNGTELTSMAILRWSQESGVAWHYKVHILKY